MSRGRGRGGKGGSSLTREHLNAMGVGAGEALPVPITEPPPLFPLLNRKPLPLTESFDMDYILILKQGFIDRMNMSGAFLKPNEPMVNTEQAIDKLLAQIPNTREKFNWSFYPVELRPKVIAKRKKKAPTKSIDIQSRLNQLEQIEEKSQTSDETAKEEMEEENEDEEKEEIQEEDEDEEMDEGTDYANNYFDNGEGYEDEDDNLDEGPIY